MPAVLELRKLTQEDAVNSRVAWSIEQVLGQPDPQSESLPPKPTEQKIPPEDISRIYM